MEKAIADNFFTQSDRHVPGLFRSGPTTATMNAGHLFHTNALKTRSLSDAVVAGRRLVQEYAAFYRKYMPGCEKHAGGVDREPGGRSRIAADRGRVRNELCRLPGAAALPRPDRRCAAKAWTFTSTIWCRGVPSATTRNSPSSTAPRKAKTTAFPIACSCPRAGPTCGSPALCEHRHQGPRRHSRPTQLFHDGTGRGHGCGAIDPHRSAGQRRWIRSSSCSRCARPAPICRKRR